MKLFLSLLLFCVVAQGADYGYRDATSTTIPAAYSSAGAELVFDSGSVQANRICCENRTGTEVWMAYNANGAAAAVDGWLYADGTGVCLDDHAMANKVFIRGNGGTVSSGYFQCRAWIRN